MRRLVIVYAIYVVLKTKLRYIRKINYLVMSSEGISERLTTLNKVLRYWLSDCGDRGGVVVSVVRR